MTPEDTTPRRARVLGFVLLGAVLLGLAVWQFGAFRAGLQLQTARARWAAQHPPSYRYVVQKGCFCPVNIVQPVRIEVRDGAALSMANAETGAPVPAADFEDVATLDHLFVLIQRAIDQGADRVEVRYDEALGYPTLISIDHISNAVDDEVSYSVEHFEEVK